MTVCIAAICEKGRDIVVATDRMFTSPLNLEFETEEKKIENLLTSCVALTAGSSAAATEVLDAIRSKLANAKNASIAEVANEAKNEYTLSRSRKIEETIILPTLGSDFMEQRRKGKTLPEYLQVQAPMYQQLATVANQYNMNLEMIVAGVDKTGAHIFVVTHPGTSFSLDKLGYAAVGSGGIHASISLSLSAQTNHRGLIETMYSVYDAKKAAEVAPGVGNATDLAIVDTTGIWHCSAPVFNALVKTHSALSKKESLNLDELKGVYDVQRKQSEPAA